MALELELIVAVADDDAIGENGRLPWDLPCDLKRFREITMGHVVIMGRNTWESLPRKPLHGRYNVVVSSTEPCQPWPKDTCFTSIDALPEVLKALPRQKMFVIGGKRLYEWAAPFAARAHVTRVHGVFPNADVRYSFPLSLFRLEQTLPSGSASYETYVRIFDTM